MVTSTSGSNFSVTYGMDPFFINWKRLNSAFDDIFRTNASNFPAYNIRKVGENKAIIELAVAGYNQSMLEITEKDNILSIVGEQPEIQEEYLYKGIAARKFTKNFTLGDYMEVTGADLVDGILYIGISRNIPEEKKPKKISIDNFNEKRKKKEL